MEPRQANLVCLLLPLLLPLSVVLVPLLLPLSVVLVPLLLLLLLTAAEDALAACVHSSPTALTSYGQRQQGTCAGPAFAQGQLLLRRNAKQGFGVWPTLRGGGGYEGKKRACVPKMGLLFWLSLQKFVFSDRNLCFVWVCGWFGLCGWVRRINPPPPPPPGTAASPSRVCHRGVRGRSSVR